MRLSLGCVLTATGAAGLVPRQRRQLLLLIPVNPKARVCRVASQAATHNLLKRGLEHRGRCQALRWHPCGGVSLTRYVAQSLPQNICVYLAGVSEATRGLSGRRCWRGLCRGDARLAGLPGLQWASGSPGRHPSCGPSFTPPLPGAGPSDPSSESDVRGG